MLSYQLVHCWLWDTMNIAKSDNTRRVIAYLPSFSSRRFALTSAYSKVPSAYMSSTSAENKYDIQIKIDFHREQKTEGL